MGCSSRTNGKMSDKNEKNAMFVLVLTPAPIRTHTHKVGSDSVQGGIAPLSRLLGARPQWAVLSKHTYATRRWLHHNRPSHHQIDCWHEPRPSRAQLLQSSILLEVPARTLIPFSFARVCTFLLSRHILILHWVLISDGVVSPATRVGRPFRHLLVIGPARLVLSTSFQGRPAYPLHSLVRLILP